MSHPVIGETREQIETRLKTALGAKYAGIDWGPPIQIWTVDGRGLTADELNGAYGALRRLDTLDSWESSKLRNLTLDQINNRIATVQSQIDAVTNVATAKTALNSMYADMQKMARIILWLLKREMNEL